MKELVHVYRCRGVPWPVASVFSPVDNWPTKEVLQGSIRVVGKAQGTLLVGEKGQLLRAHG